MPLNESGSDDNDEQSIDPTSPSAPMKPSHSDSHNQQEEEEEVLSPSRPPPRPQTASRPRAPPLPFSFDFIPSPDVPAIHVTEIQLDQEVEYWKNCWDQFQKGKKNMDEECREVIRQELKERKKILAGFCYDRWFLRRNAQLIELQEQERVQKFEIAKQKQERREEAKQGFRGWCTHFDETRRTFLSSLRAQKQQLLLSQKEEQHRHALACKSVFNAWLKEQEGKERMMEQAKANEAEKKRVEKNNAQMKQAMRADQYALWLAEHTETSQFARQQALEAEQAKQLTERHNAIQRKQAADAAYEQWLVETTARMESQSLHDLESAAERKRLWSQNLKIKDQELNAHYELWLKENSSLSSRVDGDSLHRQHELALEEFSRHALREKQLFILHAFERWYEKEVLSVNSRGSQRRQQLKQQFKHSIPSEDRLSELNLAFIPSTLSLKSWPLKKQQWLAWWIQTTEDEVDQQNQEQEQRQREEEEEVQQIYQQAKQSNPFLAAPTNANVSPSTPLRPRTPLSHQKHTPLARNRPNSSPQRGVKQPYSPVYLQTHS